MTAPPTDGAYCPVALDDWLDNRGTSHPERTGEGAFNLWGNSLPADELPPPGARVHVGGVPFVFPSVSGAGDNLRCARQLIPVPAGDYDWLYVLAAAERRTEDLVLLHFADGSVDPEWLRVSDFWPDTPPRFGERLAFRCTRMHYPRHLQRGFGPTIWRQRVPVSREAPLAAVRLPDNSALHLFALTAARRATQEEPW
ncbi:MAG: hypothetical protein ACRDZO_24425 [Egibacteraceae bacterium]